MQARSLSLSIVAVAVAVATTLLLTNANDAASPDLGQRPAVAARAATTTGSHAATTWLAAGELATVERREVQPGWADASAAACRLRGRCVDDTGAPLAGCVITLVEHVADLATVEAWQVAHPDTATPLTWHGPDAVTTGDDGRFELTFAPPRWLLIGLEVRREGSAACRLPARSLPPRTDLDLGDVVLPRGVRVTGRLVDGDGRPLAGETVHLRRTSADPARASAVHATRTTGATTAADGRFAMPILLAPGHYLPSTRLPLVGVLAVELPSTQPERHLQLVACTEAELPHIRGRVLDDNGAPIAGAKVTSRDQSLLTDAYTAADGSFEVHAGRVHAHGNVRLQAFAEGYVDEVAPLTVDWGRDDAELRLPRGAALTVRVTDAADRAVRRYAVRLLPQSHALVFRDVWPPARVRAHGEYEDGTVTVTGLAPGAWLLMVECERERGFAPLFASFAIDGDRPMRIELQATPSCARTLRAVFADGAPAADTRVRLCETFGKVLSDALPARSRAAWLRDGGRRTDPLVLFDGRTDADGRLVLRGPRGRDLVVLLSSPDHVPKTLAAVQLDVTEPLTVALDRGATLSGRIVPPAAGAELRRLAGLGPDEPFSARLRPSIVLVRADGSTSQRGRAHDEDADALLAIDDDGTYHAAGLEPGEWQVHLRHPTGDHGTWTVEPIQHATVTLTSGRTTTHDVDLMSLLPGTLAGRLLANGQPMANGLISVASSSHRHQLSTDADGRFRLRCRPDTYRLTVRDGGLVADTTATVVRGQTTRHVFQVFSATVRLQLRDATGRPAVGVRIHVLPDAEWLLASNAEGYTETVLRPGSYRARVLPRRLDDDRQRRRLVQAAAAAGVDDPFADQWLELGTFVVEAGQYRSVALPLPPAWGR